MKSSTRREEVDQRERGLIPGGIGCFLEGKGPGRGSSSLRKSASDMAGGGGSPGNAHGENGDGQGERQQGQAAGLSEPHTSDQEPKRQQITNKALNVNKANTFFLSSS